MKEFRELQLVIIRKMFDGAIRMLTDVKHIPKLKQDLKSLSTLEGYK